MSGLCPNCLNVGKATYRDGAKHPPTYTVYPCHLCRAAEYNASPRMQHPPIALPETAPMTDDRLAQITASLQTAPAPYARYIAELIVSLRAATVSAGRLREAAQTYVDARWIVREAGPLATKEEDAAEWAAFVALQLELRALSAEEG